MFSGSAAPPHNGNGGDVRLNRVGRIHFIRRFDTLLRMPRACPLQLAGGAHEESPGAVRRDSGDGTLRIQQRGLRARNHASWLENRSPGSRAWRRGSSLTAPDSRLVGERGLPRRDSASAAQGRDDERNLAGG